MRRIEGPPVAEADEDLKQAWVAQPYTQLCAHEFALSRDNALGELIGICLDSSDPEVVKAATRYVTWLEVVTLFEGK